MESTGPNPIHCRLRVGVDILRVIRRMLKEWSGVCCKQQRKPNVIQVTDLHFAYPASGFRLHIDRFTIGQGEQVALIGPSGSGKSTLLHLLAGILVPDRGSIVIDGTELTALSETARREFRISRIGLVFQAFELLDYLTVLDNLLLPFRINKAVARPRDAVARASQLADELEIADKLKRFPGQLSQGEKQRVAIGRALITEPALLFADEPTGNLDPATKKHVLHFMLNIASERGVTVLMVTHDHGLLDRFGRVCEISDFYGKTAESTPTGEMLSESTGRP
ncbi:MAG: ABC transporter ATP-binding protein [Gemmatales bacterium]|nr:MAG: ABC transporter ATP-binding protein [Gemmatales bacterium]